MTKKICVLLPLLLLLLLLFPAVCDGVSNLRTAPYKQHTFVESWSAAQTHCRNQHTDLVTISGERENNNFVRGWGWIGLHRENSTSKWKWSRSDEIASFTPWDGSDPGVGENCAFKKQGTEKWQSAHCDTKQNYMCYNERLVLVKKNKTWEQALQYCRDLEAVDSRKPGSAYQNHRYDLATLLTPDDHVFAREKAQAATTHEVWTGLRYLAGQWVWVGGGGAGGGAAVQYTDMKSCQTERFCGFLEKNGTALFGTGDCNWRRNFFCYKKKKK